MEDLRTKTSFPARSSRLDTVGEAGPDTTSSLTLRYTGAEKSTSFWRSSEIVRLDAAMSPLPLASACSKSPRCTGMNTTRTLICFCFSFFS